MWLLLLLFDDRGDSGEVPDKESSKIYKVGLQRELLSKLIVFNLNRFQIVYSKNKFTQELGNLLNREADGNFFDPIYVQNGVKIWRKHFTRFKNMSLQTLK